MNNKTSLPKANDWNNYWGLDQTKKFTKISWSKKRIINVLESFVCKDGKALDAGCGSGFFSKYFCDQSMQTTSLDYSDEALNIAQAMTAGRAKVVKKDLINSKLKDELEDRFDIIFTDGLFEHFSLGGQDRILQNFVDVLTDEGCVVTFVPNKWSPWELIRPFYMPGIEEKPFIIRELIDLHLRNGLKIVVTGGVNTFPFAFSPDKLFGKTFGMLLYVIAKKT